MIEKLSWIGAGLAFAVIAGAYVAGYRLAIVAGGSMEPTIAFGSLALFEPVEPQDVSEGDVIAFDASGTRVSHRVIAVDSVRGELTTQGDANPSPDMDRVPFADVRGRYRAAIPGAGKVILAAQHSGAWPALALILSGTGVLLFGGTTAPAGAANQRRITPPAPPAGG